MAKPTVTAELLPYEEAGDWVPDNLHCLPWAFRIVTPTGNTTTGLISGNKKHAEHRLHKLTEKITQYYGGQLNFLKSISQKANNRRKHAGGRPSRMTNAVFRRLNNAQETNT